MFHAMYTAYRSDADRSDVIEPLPDHTKDASLQNENKDLKKEDISKVTDNYP